MTAFYYENKLQVTIGSHLLNLHIFIDTFFYKVEYFSEKNV